MLEVHALILHVGSDQELRLLENIFYQHFTTLLNLFIDITIIITGW